MSTTMTIKGIQWMTMTEGMTKREYNFRNRQCWISEEDKWVHEC